MTWRPVAARAASLLLRYPDAEVHAALPLVREALGGLPSDVSTPLWRVVGYRAETDPVELAAQYVKVFDFRRRCCLYLTYFTCGDTRKRGEALVGFTAAYKRAGLEVAGGELPDFLPAVLDLAAADEGGWRLLRESRAGIDLLHKALEAERSPYRHAVEAVGAMLPPASPAELAATLRMARTGPPAEFVGLAPYGRQAP